MNYESIREGDVIVQRTEMLHEPKFVLLAFRTGCNVLRLLDVEDGQFLFGPWPNRGKCPASWSKLL